MQGILPALLTLHATDGTGCQLACFHRANPFLHFRMKVSAERRLKLCKRVLDSPTRDDGSCLVGVERVVVDELVEIFLAERRVKLRVQHEAVESFVHRSAEHQVGFVARAR